MEMDRQARSCSSGATVGRTHKKKGQGISIFEIPTWYVMAKGEIWLVAKSIEFRGFLSKNDGLPY